MPAQGPGHWLNPKTGKYIQVYRHELDIQKESNAKLLNLPQDIYEQLAALPSNEADAIRLLAMRGGLIRLRDNPVYSVQFYLPRAQVRPALWSIVQFFHELKIRPWNIWLNNLQYDEAITISMEDLTSKLNNEDRIMINEDMLPPPTDVPQSAIDRLKQLYNL